MVSVCLPSDALSQQLPSYLGFSYLGRGVSIHCCFSKMQPLLLTLDEGHLLMAAPPDLQRGVAPLHPPAPAQPPLLECSVAPLGRLPWPRAGVAPLGHHPSGMGSPRLLPLTSDVGYLFTALSAKCSHCSLPWMRGISSLPPLLTLNVE